MLRTRLWMGAILIALTTAALLWDREPFPFLLVLMLALASAATVELLGLLPAIIRPPRWLCLLAVAGVMAANWLPHTDYLSTSLPPWTFIAFALAAVVILTFLVEMATFREPGHSVTCIALTVFIVVYLGLLPSFLFQLRWLYPETHGTAALLLAVFVPKCCDIGAYFTGRLIGRHKMTPVLSPKKTWEGAAGGLVFAVLTTILLDRLGPVSLLQGNIAYEVGFGLSVGVAGMLGDLAESLIKRDMQHKDASHAVPGFGGVLDVVDAILFAAPVSYIWFTLPLAA